MNEKRKLGARLLTDTRGLTTVEYAIVLTLVAVVGISVWDSFGATLSTKIEDADTSIGKMGSGEK